MPKDATSAPASPKIRTPASPIPRSPRRPGTPVTVDGDATGPSGQDVLLFLIASRILNALIIQTFFQPDEYFQALEPAWALAFGPKSGAWLTWEWREHLRSAIHPTLFAACYRLADSLSEALSLSPPARSQVLLAAPKTFQAIIAATGDYYTWKLAETTYGIRSLAPAAALVLTVASPWQWFCSTRTFSNSLETTLTVVALYNWPWHWCAEHNEKDNSNVDSQGLRRRNAITPSHGDIDETTRLRRALIFAALATILRPTNILIWIALTIFTCVRGVKSQRLVNIPGTQRAALIEIAGYTLSPTKAELSTVVREAIFCGSTVLGLSSIVDRLFYDEWTFPPWNFLYFNVAQSIAIFYGNNNWHYYLTQGYPLLLTTALPFAIVGLYRALYNTSAYRNLSQSARHTLSTLSITSLLVPAILSIISHKEVRFIYPLLPSLHIIAAHPISTYFASAFDSLRPYSRNSQLLKRFLLGALLALNLLISLYTATVHNTGLITITSYLRNTFESHHLPLSSSTAPNMTVGFLMPCHSTPWRSHLQYPPTSTHPGIDAWALTCEPPLHMNASAKAAYLDEADLFYAEPIAWLKRHMSRNPPVPHPAFGGGDAAQIHHHNAGGGGLFAAHPAKPRRVFEVEARDEEVLWRERRGRRPWPDYLVFFQQLEPRLKEVVGRRSGYRECERVWNGHWNDDWRRRGEVVVWCLYPERRGGVGGGAVGNGGIGGNVGKGDGGGSGKVMGKEKEGVRLTVEKPFWKQMPLMASREPEGWWEWVVDKVGVGERGRKRGKGSWWNSIVGARGGGWD